MKKDKYSIISFIILLTSFIAAAVFLIVSIVKPDRDSIETYPPSAPVTEDGTSANESSMIFNDISLPQEETSSLAEETSSVPESSSAPESSSKPEGSNITYSSSEPEEEINETAYLDDALFIGDSRTVGLSYYGGIKGGTFFASEGLNITRINESVSVKGFGKTTLTNLLQNKKFGKIYIMFGINELGWLSPQAIKEKYSALIEDIRELQPDSIIFVSACIHITKDRDAKETGRKNSNINKLNNELSTLADNNYVFYINPNSIFDDKNGNLNSAYSGDGIHLYAKSYKDLSKWLCTDALM